MQKEIKLQKISHIVEETIDMLNPNKFFNLLSDETRLRCLNLLQQEGELCVCDLTYVLKLSQPKISRHLASLRKFNIVSDRREGLWIYYRLHKDLPPWTKKIIALTINATKQLEPYIQDSKRLATMPSRSTCCK